VSAPFDYGCNGCDNTWGGLSTCHCAACHRTFTNLKNFDKHRVKNACVDPESVGLVDAGRKYPCFASPSGEWSWPRS